MRDLEGLFSDPTVPIFSYEEVAGLLYEVEERIISARSHAEGAEFRYGVDHTEVAYYCGAEALAIEISMIFKRNLGVI